MKARYAFVGRVVQKAALIALVIGTMGSGGGSCCPGPPATIVAPPLDAVYCDFTAVPCLQPTRLDDPGNPRHGSLNGCASVPCTTTSGALCNDIAPGSNGSGLNDFTTCDPATCTVKEVVPSQSGGGYRQCFDRQAGVTASQACQAFCRPTPGLPSGKAELSPITQPPGGTLRTRCVAVVDFNNTGPGGGQVHEPYNATSEGATPDYIEGGCLDPGPIIGDPAGTNRVLLSGAGTFASPDNGVPASNVGIEGGFFNISVVNNNCSPLDNFCGGVVNQMEVDFDNFAPPVNGVPHPTNGMHLSLDQAFFTPSGIFLPASGTLPPAFAFELPPGIIFDSIATVDGGLNGTIATSDQVTNGTINLLTGQIVFDFDIRETVNGNLVELTGTATTAEVFDVAPVVTAPATVSADATTTCSASVTLTPSATSVVNLPVSFTYAVDKAFAGTGASKTVSLPIGPHTALIIGTDTLGGNDDAPVAITINDRTAPVFDPAPPARTQSVCSNGNSVITVTEPTAHNFCDHTQADVTGSVIRYNGVAVSIPVVNNTVTVPPGQGVLRWVATNANGVTTNFDQTLTVVGPPTFFGSRGVAIADRSVVNGSVFSGASGTVSVGNDATINGNLISLSPVQLRDRTTITFINTNAGITPGSDDHIGGTSTVTPILPAFPTITQQFTGSQVITLPPDTSRSLSPGQYGAVTVFSRARLVLSAGTYVFTSLDLEPQGVLIVPAVSIQNVRIFVRDNVIYRGRTTNSSGTIAPLFLGYTGSNPLTVENVFTGTIVAPNASLTLQSLNGTGVYTGEFFARQITLSPANTTNSSPFTCR